jgi:hypothetical protein
MNDHFNQMVEFIALYAMKPHWLDEMRRWSKELEGCQSGIYKRLGVAVAERIKLLKEKNDGE